MRSHEPGATDPHGKIWASPPTSGYRHFEQQVRLGAGDEYWESTSAALLRWGIKTRSGFSVDPEPAAPVEADDRFRLIAHLGPFRVREPVRVVAVVDRPDRRGFAYGTLPGHPVDGEEAFVVHREADGSVWLTLRSLTRAASGWWRPAFPAALVAQRFYRWRYVRAFR